MDNPTSYTHAEWHVAPGREEEFIAAWRGIAEAFATLQRPPLWGTLLRSETNPAVFYSFGPWASADDVAEMRANPTAQEAIRKALALCEVATPGPCRLVAHVTVRHQGA